MTDTSTPGTRSINFIDADQDDIRTSVARALAEDIGSGDLTAALIPVSLMTQAKVISRETAVVCGIPWFNEVFRQLDSQVRIDWQVHDGDSVVPGQVLCEIQGPARSLLSGERAALNFLQTLSGTASIARQYANAVQGFRTKILDTRKTLPGLRLAQKYAVRCGGCHNHRIGLFDAILIKENHIHAAGSITAAVQQARVSNHDIMIEVEVENLDQLTEAIECGASRILLDNMDLSMLRQAVELNAGRVELEASGGINLDNIAQIADTGVDFISIGALTKHVRAVDLSMRFE